MISLFSILIIWHRNERSEEKPIVINYVVAGFKTATKKELDKTQDEKADHAELKPVLLNESHGCVHIRPVDRAMLMDKGWLRGGASFRVFPYGMLGPGTIDPFA